MNLQVIAVRPYQFREKEDRMNLKPGEPCDHPGCLSHASHPCENCGRYQGLEWIEPEEKLPGREEIMIVYQMGDKITFSKGIYVHDEGTWFVDNERIFSRFTVLFWAPLKEAT